MIMNKYSMRFSGSALMLFLLCCGLALLSISSASAATPKGILSADHAGKVVFTKGVVSLLNDNQAARILRRGDALKVGETVRTGKTAKAVLKLIDGTQISLKEDTDFAIKAFSTKKNQEKAELQLLKGGVRVITGFINKQRHNNFKLTTSVASIGIRGTDFTAVLCEQECGKDPNKNNQQADNPIEIKADTPVKARLIVKHGSVQAKNRHGTLRPLLKESPLYVGDTLITGKKSVAVIVFKDNTRTTVQSSSEFAIEEFQFRPAQADKNQASFKLIKGSMRFLSGKIGKLNREKYAIATPTSSIGIRGTGFDLAYSNPTHLMVWEGQVMFVYPSGEVLVKTGQIYRLANKNAVPKVLKALPLPLRSGPRPDSAEIDKLADIPYLFGSRDNNGDAGLYIFVRSGEIEATNNEVHLNLGVAESGFIDEDTAFRITRAPTLLITPFIPPNAGQAQLDAFRIAPEIFDVVDYNDDGTICEIK
jgi:hypothetical protein